ncbi:MAG TPA: NADPH-dependent F420 reductase [Fimbriimonadaceae bacterium]|nr:NADPH-dependent F420 reductase [Fimbriimonadaceae bacterium]
MKIGVIGTGNVGKTLGGRFVDAAHDVRYGSREGEGETKTTIREAAEYGDVVVLATPWRAMGEVVAAAGGFEGKILLDCTNPIREDFNGPALGPDESAAEQLAALAPGARIVKIFNTVGYNIMADPSFAGEPASMLYCGDDGEAKAIAARLASDLGFYPVDAGPLIQARSLEALAWLWISMAVKYGHGREIAFRLLKR